MIEYEKRQLDRLTGDTISIVLDDGEGNKTNRMTLSSHLIGLMAYRLSEQNKPENPKGFYIYKDETQPHRHREYWNRKAKAWQDNMDQHCLYDTIAGANKVCDHLCKIFLSHTNSLGTNGGQV